MVRPFFMTSRWFADLREEKEREIVTRLLNTVRDGKADFTTLVAGLSTILELRAMQRKLDKAIDDRREHRSTDG